MSSEFLTSNRDQKHAVKRSGWKKPKDKPKRPLSAYNLFFRHEREQILRSTAKPSYKPRRSHGKIGFAALARSVAEKWKSLDEKTRSVFEAKAAVEKERYDKEVDAWNRSRIAKMTSSAQKSHDAAVGPPFCPASNKVLSSAAMTSYETPLHMARFNEGFSGNDKRCTVYAASDYLRAAAELCQSTTRSKVDLMDCTPLDPRRHGHDLKSLMSVMDDDCLELLSALT